MKKLFFILLCCLKISSFAQEKIVVHAVTDLVHEFTFYADHRFHSQYLPGQKGETDWCNLYVLLRSVQMTVYS